MFRNDLFCHTDLEKTDTGFETVVKFNWEHKVFQGHFPSKPVVPGVLLMQMVKECFETFLSVETLLAGADLKFTNPVTPETATDIKIEVSFAKNESGKYKLKSAGYAGETKFFKINMELVARGVK
jgi:3-hydroxyacyl-[acyl-carrier-protein] dehydratase